MDISINVATVNGSGSQSSNSILARSVFRMGYSVGAKNLFPSNIAGLPTWFTIRINTKDYHSRRTPYDIVVAMNAATIEQDINSMAKGGTFIYNSDIKIDDSILPKDAHIFKIPCRELMKDLTKSVKLKKLLTNMLYVGFLARILNIPKDHLHKVIQDQFKSKPSVVELNENAILKGYDYADENYKNEADNFNTKLDFIGDRNKDGILIDGNTAGGLGLTFGGCTFMAWYPITPSSSLAETFIANAEKYRKDKDGKNTFAVVQAEDELSAISMVLGAGWTGARSLTTTSGPGISLMAEAAGLSYFAEIPSVIWNVQRGGPSTGLPTRTMQGDITASYYLSHGDTEHILLFPATPHECFEFGQTCFDLAERLQTLVFVMTDLDLGMNLWQDKKFSYPDKPFDRGKVLTEDHAKELENFARYKDIDGDAIPYRTLPGTNHPNAAYFTRGTGHDETAAYSENNENYRRLLDQLKRKHNTARELVPQPEITSKNGKVGIIAFGSTDNAIKESMDILKEKGIESSYCRLKALPLAKSVKEFIQGHNTIFVVEQNRDQQMYQIILKENMESWDKLKSVIQYDGLPIEAQYITNHIEGALNEH